MKVKRSYFFISPLGFGQQFQHSESQFSLSLEDLLSFVTISVEQIPAMTLVPKWTLLPLVAVHVWSSFCLDALYSQASAIIISSLSSSSISFAAKSLGVDVKCGASSPFLDCLLARLLLCKQWPVLMSSIELLGLGSFLIQS